MWKSYFGNGCHIVGLDIEPACAQHARDGIEVFLGSQDDPSVIGSILEAYPNIDIVFDDGSHRSPHMRASFKLLYERLSANGVYLVEDTYRSYKGGAFKGGLRRKGFFIAFV